MHVRARHRRGEERRFVRSWHGRCQERLVLDAVDELHPDTERTAADLERLFRTVVRTNLHASWTRTEGFGLHFDDHDVLVVQLSARKRRRYYPPTRTAAMLHDVVRPPAPTGEPYADPVLAAGDVLFLPRGWWHGAAAVEGTHSPHLTYSVLPITGVGFFRWFTGLLPAEECFRETLPPRGSAADRDAQLAGMSDALARMHTTEDVGRAVGARSWPDAATFLGELLREGLLNGPSPQPDSQKPLRQPADPSQRPSV